MELFKEAYRFLGYKKIFEDKIVDGKMERCYQIIKEASMPKCSAEIVDIEVGEDTVSFLGIVVKSKNLSKNLRGCKRAVVFAATLGPNVDMVIRRFSKVDMVMSVIADALGSAMIEQYCDEICTYYKNKGLNLRPRFSPGYGDFDIRHQKDFMNILMCHKKIGLTLTDSFMLTPTKSVTAMMGISDTDETCIIKGCEECEKTDCEFRRS